MDKFVTKRNDLLAEQVIKNLKSRQMEGHYVQTKEEALALALELIPEGSSISWGGSMSIKAIGLPEALHKGNYKVLDRDMCATPEEKAEMMHQALNCDYFLAIQCEKMGNGRTAFLCAKLWEFFSILLDNAKSDTDYVQKAISCINAEYINGITIRQVADRLNINRSYLSDLFKKRMGISPQKYLIQLRLEKAAELLTVYGQSPSTAGISVGYPDLYHFSKIFKKHFGVSPREYQKLNI